MNATLHFIGRALEAQELGGVPTPICGRCARRTFGGRGASSMIGLAGGMNLNGSSSGPDLCVTVDATGDYPVGL